MPPTVSVTRVKTVLDIFSSVLVGIAAAFLLWTQIESRWMRTGQYQKPQTVNDLTIPADKLRHVRGTGTVALVEFTDYECPFCRSYARNTVPAVDREFVTTGRLKYITFNFPLETIHPRARKAGEAAECAARQGRYWEMHTQLFSEQMDLGAIPQLAGPLGLDEEIFTRCLEGETTQHITADIAEGRRLGVTSTPTFFIGHLQRDGSIRLTKRVTGAVPIEVLREAINSIEDGGRSNGWRSLFSRYSSTKLMQARGAASQ